MILECKIAFILNKNFINSVNNTDICRKLFVILSGENMSRNVHDIYDVILKIIILVYREKFLEFIGVNKNIKEVLKTEFVTFDGSKYYLDFLCLLDDDTLCHIEFQFPKARPCDLDRFFDYNIVAQVTHGSLTETIIINFTSKKFAEKIRRIGKSKCFNPHYVYLGDIDYVGYWRKINIKVESNLKLTVFEEIAILVTCLIPDCRKKAYMLDKISILLKNKELFDKRRFEYVQAIIQLEIENLISNEDRSNINEVTDMTPQAEKIISQAISEVHRKSVHEARLDGIEEGKKQGRKQGREQGRQEVAKNLKGIMDDEEISRISGLSLEKVKQL